MSLLISFEEFKIRYRPFPWEWVDWETLKEREGDDLKTYLGWVDALESVSIESANSVF